MTTQKHERNEFKSGVFSAMQELVIFHGEDSLAAFIAKSHGITKEWALAESKRTGFELRRMNKFIREHI